MIARQQFQATARMMSTLSEPQIQDAFATLTTSVIWGHLLKALLQNRTTELVAFSQYFNVRREGDFGTEVHQALVDAYMLRFEWDYPRAAKEARLMLSVLRFQMRDSPQNWPDQLREALAVA